jgi:hypothetical protein
MSGRLLSRSTMEMTHTTVKNGGAAARASVRRPANEMENNPTPPLSRRVDYCS